MMRLGEPEYSCEQTLDACIEGITGNTELRQKLTSGKRDLISAEAQYTNAAAIGELHTIPSINTDGNADPVVINGLRKSELIRIYDQYFVPERKPARKIYDALLNAAKEKCPFCGGIGTPRSLDHFLPKAHFPQFSVAPRNLVPACLECNLGEKTQSFAIDAEDQIIHPYADNEKFFLEQWIFAKYNASNDGEPGEFEYFASPPEEWREFEKQKARKHFRDFGLARRYATRAAEHLGIVLLQIEFLRQVGLDSETISTALLRPGVDASPFVNHWQKGMYQALMDVLSGAGNN
jgi:hypothetical protein